MVLFSQAQALIRQGVKAVPQMKYALAVGAIMGVISIVVAIFKLDLRVALFGAVLMIVLMSLVVVFARVSALQEGLRMPATIMTWFSILLMIGSLSFLFTSVFWAKPLNLSCWLDTSRCVAVDPNDPGRHLRTPQENEVIALKEKIGELRQYLLSLDKYPDSREKLAPAKDLGDQITRFSDKDLNITRRYMKREYGAMAYLMAAAAESDNPTKHKQYCNIAISNCDEALAMLKEARGRYDVDPDARLLVDWVRDDKGEDRVLYFRTEALCQRATAENDPTLKAQALETWGQINTQYKLRYPASGTAELQGCITEVKEER